MEKLIKKHAEKVRFGIVGGANTALDFGILFILVFLGLDKIPSNYISTSISFVFSFFVNKSFTFKSTGGNTKQQFTLFLVITLFGLWIIQPAIILTVERIMDNSGLENSIILLIAKLLATAVTLVWNYVLYAKYVFKEEVK